MAHNQEVNLIFASYLLDIFAWSICFPAFPRVHAGLKLTSTDIGTVAAISSLIMFMTGPLLGKASDKYGRVRLLQLSALGSGVGMLISSLSTSIPLFLVGRFLGCLVKCTLPVSQAYIADRKVLGVDVAKQNGLLMAIGSVGFIIGPVVGGQITKYSPTLPLYIAAAIYFVNFLLLFGCSNSSITGNVRSLDGKKADTSVENNGPEEKKNETDTCKESGKSKRALFSVFHHRFFFLLGYAVYETMFAQHLKDVFRMDGAAIGFMLSYCGVLSVVMNSLVLRLILRQTSSPTTLLVPLVMLQAVGLVGWGWSPNVGVTLLSCTLLSFSYNIFSNITQSNIVALASRVQRTTSTSNNTSDIGSLMGFSSTVDRAARVSASFLGGLALDRLGPLGLGAAASCVAIYCAVAVACFPLPHQKPFNQAKKSL